LNEVKNYKTITARWIIPVDGVPLEWGQIHIEGEVITSILKASSNKIDENLGEVVVLPGLVNAHTHLDLSGFPSDKKNGANFLDWIDSVISFRSSRSSEQIKQDISLGITQSLKAGICLVGDISSGGTSWDLLSQSYLGGVVYYELLGLKKERAQSSLEAFLNWKSTLKHHSYLRPGVSPHSPYSVRSQLLDFAVEQDLPLQMHLAETFQEVELLQTQRGIFADWLILKNGFDESGFSRSILSVLQTLDRNPQSIIVHGSYLQDFNNKKRQLIYCPRTYEFFNGKSHPMPEMLKAGWKIALGTDGISSNPDLNVLNEARFVRKVNPEISAENIIKMITINAAALLRLDRQNGSLTRGKQANFSCFPFESNGPSDPLENLLLGNQSCSCVMIRGKWI